MRKITQVYYSREIEYYYVSKWLLWISASFLSENTRKSVKFDESQELLTCIAGKHTVMKSTKIQRGEASESKTKGQSAWHRGLMPVI